MKSTKEIALTTLMVVLLAVSSVVGQGAEGKLQQVGEKYWSELFAFDPIYATQMGELSDQYLRYPDYTKRSINKQVSALKKLRRELKKVDFEQLSLDGKIDYRLLESNIGTELLLLEESNLIKDNPKAFSAAAVAGIHCLLSLAQPENGARLDMLLNRLSDLPRFLGSARKTLNEPPRIWLLLAEEEAEEGLTLLADLSSYYAEVVPSRQAEIKSGFAAATTALETFIDLLDALKLDDDGSFALGRQDFNALLATQFLLDFDADSLIRLGEALFAEAVVRYDSVKAIVDTLTPEPDPHHFIPSSFSRSDILDYYRWEIDQTRLWITNHDFVSVPWDVGACIPIETPAFLLNIVPSLAYLPPGPLASVQDGYFFVRPLPDSLDRSSQSAYFRYCVNRGFRASTVHEAYPGHHLQLQLANRHQSTIRRMQRNNLCTEGWALYCEEAIYNHGFYGEDPAAYLNVINGVLFRAARVIIDAKLQMGQFAYEDAIGWMMENLEVSPDFAEAEVNRYTLTPGQPMSYLLGKRQILELRELFQAQLGESYSARAFHDMLLAEGAIPPVLIQQKLNGSVD